MLDTAILGISIKKEPDFKLLHDSLDQALLAIPREPPEGLSVKLVFEYTKFYLAMIRLKSNAYKFQNNMKQKTKVKAKF
ncbi:hypothetical protein [Methylicorpusculum sp.]|uniref:hypothetical protein n=1 Tax=Methylicorpusculum sp. TaxID=2713644 RepID=UPI00272F63F3|nr:hypothetical protein [Methylicorpusculum sp.]MDP2179799.1 hypothetical protein [Methylicorpusculum sp.]MDP3528486.1 hypothetical protein [Methylicorpusculum sp.]